MTGPLVLDQTTAAVLAAVRADPHAPPRLAVQAPGGYGKSVLLDELGRRYRAAGIPVLDAGRPELPAGAAAGTVLIVDDAHLLGADRLGELRGFAEAREVGMLVAYRPWPRPPALTELTAALRRASAPLVPAPFTVAETGEHLRLALGSAPAPGVAEHLHALTGGVPRLVDRLIRAVDWSTTGAGPAAGPGDRAPFAVPRAALTPFAADLDDLDPDLHRLLLAAATGVELPADLIGALLDRDPYGVDELLAAAGATGLLGPDGRLLPLARSAVVALSPAAHRSAVWQRLAELQLRRGGPVLPVVRSVVRAGGGGAGLGTAFEAAADEALPDDPALAAELFAAAAAAGRPTAARAALAAALAGDLDSGLRLADRLVGGDSAPERAAGAAVAASALAHRGQLARSSEMYRWSGTAASIAFAAIGFFGTGQADQAEKLLADPPTDGPPTLLAGAAALMAGGVRDTLSGSATAALAALVQAAALLEPASQAVLLPDSPAALAALVALHCGELDVGDSALDRAVGSRMGAALMAPRHRLLQGWIAMARGRTEAAAEHLAAVTAGATLEPRDLLFATALEVGIARRNSDLTALHQAWGRAREAVLRHQVDLFALLPLGEFALAAARLGDQGRVSTQLREAGALLERLGNPPLWATPLHWSGLHAAILAEEPAVADEHVAALAANAQHSRYAGVLADAGRSWVAVLRGEVDPEAVEAAARGLHDAGLCWDGARLAGQAAIRTSDRRAMTALLDCARVLRGRPATGARERGIPGAEQPSATVTAPGEGRLSQREHEVADLVLAGLTYKQIGDRLFISAKTVEHHMARMRQRLGCANRSDLLSRLRAMTMERSAAAPVRLPAPRRSME